MKTSSNRNSRRKKGEQSDPATLKLAKRLSREFLHREISDENVQAAEAITHYGFREQ